ncbi:juvenile hormone esterase-like [Epargyreus clarus]|uniref:juvenile hormone esterase-like n=1 Tax=Epargyreus clarus TaxID=520877 RepID=UPI003C2D4980
MDHIDEDCKCIIEIDKGSICGFINKKEGENIYVFSKIPYAKPPVGALRFLPPSPIQPWTETLDCTQEMPKPLSLFINYEIIGSEDCLYLEVFTPNINPDQPMAVMFWIGSFNFMVYVDFVWDPKLLLNQNIVYVRCGFRLGPLGFLSVNDFTAPGNNGLKDIVMALQWVKKNISKFGGDPDNVTIFGSSTGAAIVHLMMLSPMAYGLFHKAIMQNACALNNWSLDKKPVTRAMELAKKMGITSNNVVEAVEELRSFSATDIMETCRELSLSEFDLRGKDIYDSIFKPCIEDEFESQSAFLTKSPYLIIKSGNYNKVPFIIGSNNTAGHISKHIKEEFYNYEKFKKNVDVLVPKCLDLGDAATTKLGQQLFDHYIGADDTPEHVKTHYLQLVRDYNFLYYVNKTLRLHSRAAPECPIFYYIINNAGEWCVPKCVRYFACVGYSTEIPFLFDMKIEPDQWKGNRDALTTRSRVVKMWTNFAKFGTPTPDENDSLLSITWEPVEDENKINYLSIGTELTKGKNPFSDRMRFWEDLHTEHRFLSALLYFNNMGISW